MNSVYFKTNPAGKLTLWSRTRQKLSLIGFFPYLRGQFTQRTFQLSFIHRLSLSRGSTVREFKFGLKTVRKWLPIILEILITFTFQFK